MILDHVIKDLTESDRKFDFQIDRAAAVNHLMSLLVSGAMMIHWVDNRRDLPERNFGHVENLIKGAREQVETIAFPREMYARAMFNPLEAEMETYSSVDKRRKVFSDLNFLVTTWSDAQGGGAIERNVVGWDIPLEFGDGRKPEQLSAPFPHWCDSRHQ